MSTESQSDTAERIHWQQAHSYWDGEAFRVLVPHYIDGYPTQWLARYLDGRIRALPGCADLVTDVSGPVPVQREGSVGWDKPGFIDIAGFRSPFPDVDLICEAILGAAREADDEAKTAEADSDRLLSAFARHSRDS